MKQLCVGFGGGGNGVEIHGAVEHQYDFESTNCKMLTRISFFFLVLEDQPHLKWAFLSPGRFFKISNQDLEPPERLASLRYQHQGITIPLHTMFRNQSKSAGRQERSFTLHKKNLL